MEDRFIRQVNSRRVFVSRQILLDILTMSIININVKLNGNKKKNKLAVKYHHPMTFYNLIEVNSYKKARIQIMLTYIRVDPFWVSGF